MSISSRIQCDTLRKYLARGHPSSCCRFRRTAAIGIEPVVKKALSVSSGPNPPRSGVQVFPEPDNNPSVYQPYSRALIGAINCGLHRARCPYHHDPKLYSRPYEVKDNPPRVFDVSRSLRHLLKTKIETLHTTLLFEFRSGTCSRDKVIDERLAKPAHPARLTRIPHSQRK